jgi:hypothetical protein
MIPTRVVMGVAAILFILVLFQDVQVAGTYDYVTEWGAAGTGNGPGKMPRNNLFNRWCKQCSGM